ncbi:hypothetical protein DM558_01515 [Entomomonas moraniae]|uniref:Uncharacterized protein n=1 Tax=Entomomonas moraniae TaxID=2213226 RepID=A0A3S9XAS8_9GAMM|nr:hypothetical protein [Entomomonas moraniae]AZS49533.1 hypothetical protein DM558_01515 [Entomomonas moraniae]
MFNLLISAFIAVIFIKKTKLAEGVVCSSSILELLKAGITWQMVGFSCKSHSISYHLNYRDDEK